MNKEVKPSWLGSGSGKFTVGKCYSHILDLNAIGSTKDMDWKWIWRLNIPSIIITFIWL